MNTAILGETVAVQLRIIDVLLVVAVIKSLGELSGDECEILGEILSETASVLGKFEGTQYNSLLLQRKDMQAIADLKLTPRAAAMSRTHLLARVKAFTAVDIPIVISARAAFDKALKDSAEGPTEE